MCVCGKDTGSGNTAENERAVGLSTFLWDSGEDEAVSGTGKLCKCELLPEDLFMRQSEGLSSILGVKKIK